MEQENTSSRRSPKFLNRKAFNMERREPSRGSKVAVFQYKEERDLSYTALRMNWETTEKKRFSSI